MRAFGILAALFALGLCALCIICGILWAQTCFAKVSCHLGTMVCAGCFAYDLVVTIENW